MIESIYGEKFNKDMRMATNMLINAYEEEETGESKERFRHCFGAFFLKILIEPPMNFIFYVKWNVM